MTLADYDRWLHARAAAMLPPDTLHRGTAIDRGDLAQIGRIAMWDAESTYDPARGAEPAWLTMRAKGKMLSALRAREKHEVYAGYFELATDDAIDPYGDLEDRLLVAYHEGEIAAAMAELTPRQREYVRLRFWGQRTERELTQHFGYNPSGVWAGARRKLEASLCHLRDAV